MTKSITDVLRSVILSASMVNKRTKFCVAAAGATLPVTVDLRSASGTWPRTGAATSVSVSVPPVPNYTMSFCPVFRTEAKENMASRERERPESDLKELAGPNYDVKCACV